VRIALDLTPSAKPRRTGIGWYAAHLANALTQQIGPDDLLLFCTRLSRWRAQRDRPAPIIAQVRQRWFQAPYGPRGRPDVFHGTDARLPERCSAALVATVHDVFSLESDRYATDRFRAKKQARYEDAAARAARIIFPSEATRRSFCEHFKIDSVRGSVIYHGIDPSFAPAPKQDIDAVRKRLGLPERYALYVGEISLRKNLPAQARALALSKTDLPWVWVGSDSFGAEEILAAVDDVEGLRVIRTGYVPSEYLTALYAGASLLTFATSNEGFGLPALEAMACGTPVVTSNRGALPEITGGHALAADPESPEEIGDAIRRLVEDSALRSELRQRGLERAREFTWERTARETLAVYREAATA
jgi:glycosyltransferase involved in cell wall biosynthesis